MTRSRQSVYPTIKGNSLRERIFSDVGVELATKIGKIIARRWAIYDLLNDRKEITQ